MVSPFWLVRGKIGDGMVFSLILQGAVHQLGVDHRGLIDSQQFFGLQSFIKKIYDYSAKAEKHNPEKAIFGEKRAHTFFDKDTLVNGGVQE